MATLPDMLRAELTRCHRLADDYEALGTAGAFACALLQGAMGSAEQALQGGDVKAVQAALTRLRVYREWMPERPSGRRPPWATTGVWARPAPREQFFTYGRAA